MYVKQLAKLMDVTPDTVRHYKQWIPAIYQGRQTAVTIYYKRSPIGVFYKRCATYYW